MSAWVDVCPLENLPPGTRRVVDVDGAAVAVFNIDGALYAIEDVCTHDGGQLASGELAGDAITCPRHGARFSVKTGAVLAPPAYAALHVFPLRVEQGMVQVADDRWR
jgi:3-phenylpropionate/trans-cinnamate dioxygenase ferredoxin component